MKRSREREYNHYSDIHYFFMFITIAYIFFSIIQTLYFPDASVDVSVSAITLCELA